MPAKSPCLKKSLRRSRRLTIAGAIVCAAVVQAQGPERGPSPASPQELRAAIERLGDIDYATRTKVARLVRRTPAPQAVPALLQAAQEHADGYVRYKSLVLLTGFGDPRTADQMIEVLGSPNDRLREVAYGYFERVPSPALSGRL